MSPYIRISESLAILDYSLRLRYNFISLVIQCMVYSSALMPMQDELDKCLSTHNKPQEIKEKWHLDWVPNRCSTPMWTTAGCMVIVNIAAMKIIFALPRYNLNPCIAFLYLKNAAILVRHQVCIHRSVPSDYHQITYTREAGLGYSIGLKYDKHQLSFTASHITASSTVM